MEELKVLKYKVIADFPMSILNVGDIVEVYNTSGMCYVVGDRDEQTYKVDVRDYPHLFELVKENV